MYNIFHEDVIAHIFVLLHLFSNFQFPCILSISFFHCINEIFVSSFKKFYCSTEAADLLCFTDYKPMLELVDLLVMKFATTPSLPVDDDLSSIIDTILQLMLVILEGLKNSEDFLCISGCSLRWAPIFQLNNSRYEQHGLDRV